MNGRVVTEVDEVNPEGITLEEAMRKEVATQNIIDTVRRICRQEIIEKKKCIN